MTTLTLQQALEEAQRCLLCHDAPCSKGCPGGTDPSKFIRQIRFYNLKGSARTVMGNNPLGGVCAYICPTDETCERECLRSEIDRPIDIAALQAFAVEYGREHGVKALNAGPAREERVAIVGAGPAGLTAAAHLAERGYQITLFEANAKSGGMLRYGVPQHRLGDAVIDADVNEILALGVTLETDTTVDPERAQKLLDEGYAAVFVAPGLWRPYQLDIDGIDLDGVSNALDFLRQVYTDSATATALVKGKNVAIIGGGSVAMDAASCARKLGAERIYAIALEGMTELPAQRAELDHAFADGVVIKPQSKVSRLVGEDGKVIAVEGVETEWIEPGNFSPSNARPIEGTHWRLRVDTVVQAIGQGPTEAVGGIVATASKKGNLIKVTKTTQATSVERVFAGGDIARGAGTVIAAVGDGKRAAKAIDELLSNGKEATQ
jgi:NADPH-dependent glutamate synthase beta subunit-like oxidoreductase